MVAEGQLYWITYTRCTNTLVEPAVTEADLQAWRTEWEWLFGKITTYLDTDDSEISPEASFRPT